MIGALLDALGLRAPAAVRHPDDLRPGKAVLFGTLHTETPIESPVHGKPCAAFYYRASFRRASRVKGFAQALLRDALVYADGLTVDIEGTPVTLTPLEAARFDRAAHRALVAEKIDGFKASEKRVPVGAQVAVHGKLVRKGGAWHMVFGQLGHQGSEKPRKA